MSEDSIHLTYFLTENRYHFLFSPIRAANLPHCNCDWKVGSLLCNYTLILLYLHMYAWSRDS
jgi:hypothetical protein